MTKKAYRRFLSAAIMLLLTGFLIVTGPRLQTAKCAPGAANARCSSLPVYTYYTDASKTVACGYLDVCSGAEEGCHTDFKTSQRKPCGCDQPPPASSEK
jgi:hypothetical protein